MKQRIPRKLKKRIKSQRRKFFLKWTRKLLEMPKFSLKDFITVYAQASQDAEHYRKAFNIAANIRFGGPYKPTPFIPSPPTA